MAKLTAKERNKIPSKDFALPEERAFPIEDETHAGRPVAGCTQGSGRREKGQGSCEEEMPGHREVLTVYRHGRSSLPSVSG